MMINYKLKLSKSSILYINNSKLSKRLMATHKLSELPKSSTFTDSITPDIRLPSKEVALENANNIIRTPRILKDGGFSWTLPEPRKSYKYLTSSETALKDLGLDPNQVNDEVYQKIVSGEIYQDESYFKINNDDDPSSSSSNESINNDQKLEIGNQSSSLPFPYSQAYAGWQFGQFAGQLGDGRVHNLFEIPKFKVDRNNRNKYEFQLKGSGMTPFSRFADGKAVLRSSIREYIISEHLNSIGIPSTRALSLTYLPKTFAQRYGAEKCAIVSRFAELWIRLGSFDLLRWRGDRNGVRQLSDYIIKNLFTINQEKFGYLNNTLNSKKDLFDNSKQSIGELTDYDKMYLEIIVRNAETTAKWQSYGFLNGVLNTDNTSVLGLSIDFGPFSIMDKYDPNYTPNSEDHERRYGYANTPTSIWWNLTRLGEDLAEMIGAGSNLINDEFFINDGIRPEWEDKIITRATKLIEVGGEIYKYSFTKKYVETLFSRLGLPSELINPQNPDEQNADLIDPMLDLLYKVKCDYNKFFLILQSSNFSQASFDPTRIAELILLPTYNKSESRYKQEELIDDISKWLKIYKKYLDKAEQIDTKLSRTDISSKYNPLFLPRNWILDQVIQYTQDSNGEDLSYLKKLEKMSFYPYDKSKWGSDLKELESTWLLQSDMGEDYAMLQCSCSS